MKKRSFFDIIVLFAIIGLLVVGCENPSGGGKKNNDSPDNLASFTGTVSITAAATFTAWEELTATYTGGTETDITYEWKKDSSGTVLATGTMFTPTATTGAGTYTVNISKDGYNSKSASVTVNPAQLTTTKWTEILTNIDNYLTGDGVLDLSDYLRGNAADDVLNNEGIFKTTVGSDKVKTIILPDAATAIAEGWDVLITPHSTFDYFTNLSTVKGTGITLLKNKSMSYATIENIDFPNLETIEDSAFFSSKLLTSITIPASVTSIGNGAFKQTNLTSVTFEGDNVTIGGTAFPLDNFYGSDALKNVYQGISGGIGTYTRTAGQDDWTKQS